MAEITVAPASPPEHRWSYDLRRWVIIGLVVSAAILLYWIRDTLPVLILTLLLAYLLNPIVGFLQRRLRLSRLPALALVYLTLLGLLITLPAVFLPRVLGQVIGLNSQLDQIAVHVSDAIEQLPFAESLGIGTDSQQLSQQLRAELDLLTEQAPRLLMGVASRAFNVIVILVLSFYLLKDSEDWSRQLTDSIPPAYRDEWRRIRNELVEIWSGFLRGQIVLALIIGIVTGLALTILGVPGALALGILAGVLEVVPTIGPIIAAVPAVLIAFFQGSANWQIDNTVFALIVAATYVVIQQLENHLIVPNVLGRSVNLPPVVILIGALVGASLAGILGVFLAAPLLATGRLLFGFVLRKLFEPLPESASEQLATRD